MLHSHPPQVESQASSFTARQLSMTAWAFASARHHDDALYAALLEQLACMAAAGGCDPEAVSTGLWAAARMGCALGGAQERLVEAARQLMPRMNTQELSNTVWALGVLEQLDADTWACYCECLDSLQGESAAAGASVAGAAALAALAWCCRSVTQLCAGPLLGRAWVRPSPTLRFKCTPGWPPQPPPC